MTRTSKMLCTTIFLAPLLGTLLHAQVPAGSKRPAQVPEDYVITPNGYFHPSCVRGLKKGEILLTDRHAIQHVDGSIEIIPICQYPHYTAVGEIVTSDTKPPTISHAWIEQASTTTSTSFGELTANWVVPPVPLSNNGQIVFFFPGMEDANDVISIIQPVLQYGISSAGGGNYWAIASWNCCISGTTYYSSLVNVSPGDILLGTMRSTCAAGVVSCATWNITTQDQTTGGTTTLSNSSADGQTFNWAFAGALEVYSIAQCSNYPPIDSTNFYNLALYDYNFNKIASPGWSYANWSSGLTPQCSYGGSVDNSAEVTLVYGLYGDGQYGSGSVAFSGNERFGQLCPPGGNCFEYYDGGTVSLTVDGHTDSANYGDCSQTANHDTPWVVATRLASAVNSDNSAHVVAASDGDTMYFISKTAGTGGDYSFSANSVSTCSCPLGGCPWGSGGTSFPVAPASGKLTGG